MSKAYGMATVLIKVIETTFKYQMGYMRTKLTDGSQTGNLHTATIPWRMFSMDITGPFMQASISENWYQCAIIERI